MDTQDLIDMLPWDIDNCKDVNALRNLREHIDRLVQDVKHEKEAENIEKYRQIYEGKLMLTSINEYGKRVTTIRKIVSVRFVGRVFIRCKTKGIRIKYDNNLYEPSMLGGLYSAAEIEYIEDDDDDISLCDEPTFIDEAEIRRRIEEFDRYTNAIYTAFKLERND